MSPYSLRALSAAALLLFPATALAAVQPVICGSKDSLLFVEEPQDAAVCGTSSSECIGAALHGRKYFVCPARKGKVPRACPAGQKAKVTVVGGVARVSCGRVAAPCTSVNPPANSLYDCRPLRLRPKVSADPKARNAGQFKRSTHPRE